MGGPPRWTMTLTFSTPGLYWQSTADPDPTSVREKLLSLQWKGSRMYARTTDDHPNKITIGGDSRDLYDKREEMDTITGIIHESSELQRCSGFGIVRIDVPNIRRLGLMYLDRDLTPYVPMLKTINAQYVPMRFTRDFNAESAVVVEFLDALEHNLTITSICPGGSCSPFVRRRKGCIKAPPPGARRPKVKAIRGCPTDIVSQARLPGTKDGEYFEENFDEWYYAARIVAITGIRNAELERRVHKAVYRLLPYLRITLNAAGNSTQRLPDEVMDHIGVCMADGALTKAQMARLRAHATDREEWARVAKLMNEGATRQEWLYNGGFWWDQGYQAAKDELKYNNTEWPPVENLEAVFQFLAFQPVASGWSYGMGDIVEKIMRKYETETETE